MASVLQKLRAGRGTRAAAWVTAVGVAAAAGWFTTQQREPKQAQEFSASEAEAWNAKIKARTTKAVNSRSATGPRHGGAS